MAISDNPFAPSKETPPEFDVKELRAPGTVRFRLRKEYWISTLISVGLFICMGLVVVTAPEMPGPDDDLGPAWMYFVLAFLSLAPLVWIVQVRLWFTPRSVVFRELFTQAIPLADVNHIVWRLKRSNALVEIHGPARCIVLRLDRFEWKDQNAIVAAIRSTFPHDIQSGWNDAFETRLNYGR